MSICKQMITFLIWQYYRLENTCYNIGNKIKFKFDAGCLPPYTELKARVYQLQPVTENPSSLYDPLYVSSEDKEFAIEVTDALVPGYIYCVELSTKDDSISVIAGEFVVTKKGCDKGKCVKFAFIDG